MTNPKTVLLLLNIGSPEELSVPAVRRYLRQFLMDPYVIQIPFLLRYLLFYLLICNIRAPRTFAKYRSIWTSGGSPFHIFTEKFRGAIEACLGFRVLNVMMYSEPGFATAFAELQKEKFGKILVCPMYPQYADSSTLTSLEKFRTFFAASGLTAEVSYLEEFYQEDFFINSLLQNIVSKHPDYRSYDHVVFSYHGLPESHIERSKPERNYRRQCFATTELLATKLALLSNTYVTCFQSRVGVTKWITPYLDQTCDQLARDGKKNILVISPSFVVDGLETLQEIADLETLLRRRYEIRLQLVTALNSEPVWVQNFAGRVRELIAK